MLSPARKAYVEGETIVTQTQDEEHMRLRRVLIRELTVKRVEAYRARSRKIANDLIDELIAHGGPVDLVSQLTLQLPMRVIAEMLGVPYEDHEFFERNSARRVMLDVPAHVPLEATREMAVYFDRLLVEREANPGGGDDILMRLARDHVATGAISHHEAVQLAYQIVAGGHETTANMISLGVLLLLRSPDQLSAILADPSLIHGAVEEMLRYCTILHVGMTLVAVEDLEIGGRWVRKGEGVFASLISANHDPAAFPDPDVFNIQRSERHHVAFSYGVHQCVGQQLARMEMQEVFSVLFQRLPNLRLAVPFEELRFKHQNIVFGVDKLPVTW
jgi:cytochrome P450